MKSDRAFLADILDEAGLICRELEGVSEAEFREDVRISRTLLHSLMIIGEASARLSKELTSRYPHVPWAQIVALRNRIVHNYGAIELHVIWNICQCDLPQLAACVAEVLRDEDEPQAASPPQA